MYVWSHDIPMISKNMPPECVPLYPHEIVIEYLIEVSLVSNSHYLHIMNGECHSDGIPFVDHNIAIQTMAPISWMRYL